MCHRLKSHAPHKLARNIGRTSLSNWANAAWTLFISFAVEVSSIGSVAERSKMPSDCRCGTKGFDYTTLFYAPVLSEPTD